MTSQEVKVTRGFLNFVWCECLFLWRHDEIRHIAYDRDIGMIFDIQILSLIYNKIFSRSNISNFSRSSNYSTASAFELRRTTNCKYSPVARNYHSKLNRDKEAKRIDLENLVSSQQFDIFDTKELKINKFFLFLDIFETNFRFII